MSSKRHVLATLNANVVGSISTRGIKYLIFFALICSVEFSHLTHNASRIGQIVKKSNVLMENETCV